MSIRQILLIVGLVVAAGTTGFFVARTQRGVLPTVASANTLQIGDRRPDLVFTDLEGRPVALAQFDGRPVLLNFWASWCPPCIAEMPLLDAFAKAHPQVQVIGIAVEPAEAAREYLSAHPLSYLSLIGSAEAPDESQQFGNQRSVLPYSVLLGADGRMRKRRAGAFSEGELDAWLR